MYANMLNMQLCNNDITDDTSNTMCSRYITVIFLPITHERQSISRECKSDWYVIIIIVVLCALSYHIYNRNISRVYSRTVPCRYNAVNFLANINKRHPLEQGVGCILWIQHLIDILPQFLQLFVQYLTILDCIIMALGCISFNKFNMNCE